MKRYWFLALISLVLLSCGNSRQEVADLEEEVMAIHDSSMVKMDAIYNRISKLKKANDALEADSTQPNEALSAEITAAMADLRSADDAMMDWMAAYKAPTEDAPAEESIVYLEAEKISITQVDQQIDASIEQADRILSKNTQSPQP